MSVIEGMRPPGGLRVLVTAGASGIGLEITAAFAEAGASVLVGDVDEEALVRLPSMGGRITGIAADVADDASVERLMATVAERLGGLDVLVNNAGVAGPTGGVEAIEPSAWRRTIDVNITGMFLVTRLAVPLLKRSGSASIVNLSSVAGRLGYAWRTPYAASKWAVVGFTQSLAKELGPDGITVNALLPGIVRGPRIDKVIEARAATTGKSFDAMRDEMLSKVSLRSMVEPGDVAAMALYLSSPAGRRITGQALSLCAGVESL